jgi:hypothetical protein
VIRDYVRAANADAKYLALADELEQRQGAVADRVRPS